MNIHSALSQLRLPFGNVVRTAIYVRDIDDWQEVGPVQGKILSEDAPRSIDD
jgi:hypothetical protein